MAEKKQGFRKTGAPADTGGVVVPQPEQPSEPPKSKERDE